MTDTYKRQDISKDTIEFKITIPNKEFKKEYTSLLKKELEESKERGQQSIFDLLEV